MPRPNERNERTNDRRAPAPKASLGMYIPILLGAVIVCGVGLAMMTDGPKKAEQPAASTAPARDPFADLPPEKPPERGASGGSKYTFIAKAPEGLEENANWKKALVLAKEGEEIFQLAAQAHAASDRTTLNDKGKQARDKFVSAVEITAEWEEELLAKYGDGNASVRAIIKQRSKWIERMTWLHKTISI
jgi:hypothetical protein